jgi:hypothetical protein
MDAILLLVIACFVIGGSFGLYETFKPEGGSLHKNELANRDKKQSTLSTRVAGVSHKNESGPSRQVCVESLKPYDEIWLSRDSNNRFDKNAVGVFSENGQLGFLPKEVAEKLADLDVTAIKLELRSKGKADNGLWGCTIELRLPQTPAPIRVHSNKTSQSGFKKSSAITAAKAGVLGRNQLLAVIDQANHLGLNKDEVAVFETALHSAKIPEKRSSSPRPAGFESTKYLDDPYGLKTPIDPTDIDHDNGFDGVGEYWHDYHKHD